MVVTDLHMPGAGDGLIVVGAMRQANPKAVTIILSANPDMRKATAAILRQADKILLKPVKAGFNLLAAESPILNTIRRSLILFSIERIDHRMSTFLTLGSLKATYSISSGNVADILRTPFSSGKSTNSCASLTLSMCEPPPWMLSILVMSDMSAYCT